MSYSIPIAIDDGHSRVLEARFLHVSLEDRGHVILYHDLIGHSAPSLLATHGRGPVKGRIRSVCQQQPGSVWVSGHQSVRERDLQTRTSGRFGLLLFQRDLGLVL